MKKAAASAAVTMMIAACASAPRASTVQARLGEAFQLPKGQTAALAAERLTVTFDNVESDSRCPMNVQCIRAGEARVHFQLRQTGQDPEDVILATEGAQPRYATYGAFDVHLVSLEPQPRTDVPRPAYVVTLRVVRH